MATPKIKNRKLYKIKNGTGGKIPIKIEDIKINIPKQQIRMNEKKLSFSVLTNMGMDGKSRVKVTLFESQAKIAFKRYEKLGKQPKWEKND